MVCAQAFHWFDLDRALPEIARVLRPGGRLALVWNQRDERIPWVRRLGRLIGTQDQPRDRPTPLVQSSLFGFVEDATFRFWQTVDRESIQDLVLSRSNVAVLDEEARAAKLAEVLAFYDDYGRGMDGMQLPYEACCFRAVVVDQQPRRRRGRDGGRSPRATLRPTASEPRSRTAPTPTCCSSTSADNDSYPDAMARWRWLRPGHLGTEADRATFRTLHTASLTTRTPARRA